MTISAAPGGSTVRPITRSRIEAIKSLTKDFKDKDGVDDKTLFKMVSLADQMAAQPESQFLPRKSEYKFPWKIFSTNHHESILIPGKRGSVLGEGATKKATVGIKLSDSGAERVAVLSAKLEEPKNAKRPSIAQQQLDFQREGEIGRKLAQLRGDHMSCSEGFYQGSSKKKPCIRYTQVMPLGQELFDWRMKAKASDLKPVVMLPMLLHMARDITNLHHVLHMAHRDIKLENFLVTKDQAQLIDFGTTDSEIDALKKFKGTPEYFAPEMLAAFSAKKGCFSSLEDAQKADIFAFGCVCYALIAGAIFPFSTHVDFTETIKSKGPLPSYEELRHLHNESLKELRKEASEAKPFEQHILKIVEKMTAFSPEDRPSIQEVTELLKSHNSDLGSK